MTQNTGPNIQGSIVINDNFKEVTDNLKSFVKGIERATNQITQSSNNVSNAIRAMGGQLKNSSSGLKAMTSSQNQAAEAQERFERSIRVTDTVLAANTRAITASELAYQRLEGRLQASALSDTEKENALRKAKAALDANVAAINQYSSRSNTAAQTTRTFKKEITETGLAVAKSNREFRGQAINDLKNNFRELGASAALALGPLNGVASRLIVLRGILNRNSAAITALIGSFTLFTVALTKSIRTAVEAETSFLRIESTLESMGVRAKASAAEIMDLGASVAMATLTSTAEARQGALVLAGFSNIAVDSFERILITAQGMSEQLGGNLVDNTKTLGRALQDPIGRMALLERQVGSMNRAVVANIKSMAMAGDMAGAQAALLDTLADKHKLATDAAAGLAGSVDSVGETFTRFREQALLGSGGVDAANEQVQKFLTTLNELEQSGAIDRIGNAFVVAINTAGNAVNFLARNFEALATIAVVLSGSAIVKVITMLAKLSARMLLGVKAVTTLSAAMSGGLLAGFKVITTALAAMNPWVFALRVGLLALGPVLGLMSARFLTSGKSAGDAVDPIQAFVGAMDEVIRVSRQVRDFNVGIDEQADALSGAAQEAMKLAERQAEIAATMNEWMGGGAMARASDVAKGFEYLDHTAKGFEKQVFALAYEVDQLEQSERSLTAEERRKVESFRALAGEGADVLMLLGELQREYNNAADAVTYQVMTTDNLSKALEYNTRAASENQAIYERVSESVATLADTYDREYMALQRLEEDYLRIQTEMEALEALKMDAVDADQAVIKSIDDMIEALKRMEIENRKQMDSATGSADKIEELGNAYRTLVRDIAATERETKRLKDLYATGIDNKFLTDIDDQTDKIRDNIEGLNNKELQALADQLGASVTFGEGGADIDDLVAKYREWYTAQMEAQRSTNELLESQQRLSEFMQTEPSTYGQIVSDYENAIMDARRTGNREAITELESRMDKELAILEQQANKLSVFNLDNTAQQIEEEREQRAVLLAEMYHDDEERYKEHLERMNAEAKKAKVFANFVAGASMAEGTLSAIMSSMESMNRQSANSYKDLARMQATVAAALGISKIWGEHSQNPVYAAGLTALASAQFGAQLAAINAAKFNTGGYVSGQGGPKDDRIPAWLSNGEFVMNARSVSQIGLENLEMLNQGRMPNFNQGGAIMPVALGSGMSSGAGVSVQIIDQRSSKDSAPVETEEFLSPDGQQTIRVIIRDMVRQEVNGGGLDRQMNQSYGLSRRPKKR